LLVAGVSWEAPVVGFGLCGILTAIAIWVHVTNSHAHGAGTATGRIKPATKVAGWGIRNPQAFTALCLIEILDSSTRTGFLTFIAFLLIAKGLPEGWAVLSVPLVLVGGMAGKLACGILAERFGIIRMIVITELATGCGILATLALPGAASFLLLPLIGVVLNGTSSVLYATIGDFVEQDRLPRVFGLFYTIGSLCGIAAPLGYGLIGDLYGVETSIAIIGVAIFLTVPLAIALRPASASRLKSA
jgi:FSR family fosmidomycin resistance protein-like MFS transporter